ncbi:MAG TPA: cytochrome P450 [Pseudonocardiaceae bacterium]|jgi:cytochrome P450|nr:cytochrome P450 [Pseudonocardiaceae bacterium]
MDHVEELGADFFADPHATYRRWRDRGAVHEYRMPSGTRCWVITGYSECRTALADPRLAKSAAAFDELTGKQTTPFGTDGANLITNMLFSDPPDHTRLRKLVNAAFTAHTVRALRPRVEEITSGLLDRMAEQEQVDLVDAFAAPLPIAVISELLGVPLADRGRFRAWVNSWISVGSVTSADEDDEAVEAARAMTEYLTDLVRTTRERPGTDLLSALVRARDDGDKLSERELISMAFLLLVAGFETTINLIGNSVYALLCHPDQLLALRRDPSLVPAAVEEFLRYDGPVNHATFRYATEPVVFDGIEIPTGGLVSIALPAANRDPERFAHPDRLDVSRDAGGHIAFGYGIHFCVGAPLARLEAEIAFTQLLARFPNLGPAVPLERMRWQPSVRKRGLTALPVRLR